MKHACVCVYLYIYAHLTDTPAWRPDINWCVGWAPIQNLPSASNPPIIIISLTVNWHHLAVLVWNIKTMPNSLTLLKSRWRDRKWEMYGGRKRSDKALQSEIQKKPVGTKLSWCCHTDAHHCLICWQWVMFHKINAQSSRGRVISAVAAIWERVLGRTSLHFHSWHSEESTLMKLRSELFWFSVTANK